MRKNATKQMLREGKVALGSAMIQFQTAEVPRMYAAAGLDWIFIDTEHGCFTIETVQDLIRASLMTTITPIVRVAEFQYSLVSRALDMGAEGIIFPRVEDPELLAKAVSWTKFPPRGIRGFGLTPPHVGYSPAPFDEIIQHCNDETLNILQVETVAAVERCDELASVPGVDAIMIGPADLSISLGVGGQFDHPKLAAAIEKVIETCQRHKIWPSIHVRNPQLAKHWIGKGMKLVSCGSELTMLWNAAQTLGKEMKAAAGR
jgi:2-dehydro-3-deoxyglucarate aldolase/4-hydroxy-2-oxoheptanedioate aldolase